MQFFSIELDFSFVYQFPGNIGVGIRMSLEVTARIEVFEHRRLGAGIVRCEKLQSEIIADKKYSVEPLVIPNEPRQTSYSRSCDNHQHRAARPRQLFRGIFHRSDMRPRNQQQYT